MRKTKARVFSLGKQHKFKKYYVKLWLFFVDISLTNDWIYYKLSNEKVGEKYGDRADFYIQLANELIRQDIDFEAKYKVNVPRHHGLRRRRTINYNEGSDDEETDTGSVYSGIEELILPQNVQLNEQEHESVERYLKISNKGIFQPCSFTALPFTLKKHAKACQVCQYELKKPKWKDVVLCPSKELDYALQ